MRINKIGDPVLRCRSTDTVCPEGELQEIIGRMTDVLLKAKGLGLAAPQVGILKRLFIYDMGDGVKAMLNPVIVEASRETTVDTEGCLSIPGYEMSVERNERVTVEAGNELGERRKIEAEGLMARMFQHEIDHLDGILIIDRTTNKERMDILKGMIREDEK